MSGLVASPPRSGASARLPARGRTDADTAAGIGLRIAAFAALSAYGVAHWGGLVAAPPTSRLAAVAALATACGALLAASVRLPGPPAARAGVRLLAVLATLALTLMVVGLEARLLLPANWDELREGLDQGLAGLRTIDWPYAGSDEWVRLTLLLGAPPLVSLAAALAFWPARRGAGALRTLALVLLLLVYGVAVTEREFGAELVRGVGLTLLVVLWLWPPRLRGREAGVAAAVVVGAAILAMPVAAGLDRDKPWFDYRDWDWFGAIGGTTFDWDHSYGPIDWPREGSTLLRVKAERPLYWKVEVLDRFDGFRWVRSGATNSIPAGAELPHDLNPAWEEDASITVRNLRSELAVVTGTPFFVDGLGPTAISADGTTRSLDGQLQEGDSYQLKAYVPNPSSRELRAAPQAWEAQFRSYLRIELPLPGETNLNPAPRVRQAASAGQVAIPPFRGEVPAFDSGHDRALRGSAYAEVYALARRLAAGQPTTYDVVKRIEGHLLSGRYAYSEQPPSQEYPLDAFLFEDRIGYCQQFSGAMALMLRMNGIPARVVGGFSGGSFNRETKDFRVRDLDAHSWVEVHFPGLGWVQFDPTPSGTPARSRAEDESASAAGGSTAEPDPRLGALAERQADPTTGRTQADGGGGLPAWALLAVAAALAALLALAVWVAALVQRRRAPAGVDGPLRELVRALRRLGYPLPPQTTLLALEGRLARSAGPDSAAYVRALREHRFGANGAALPGGAERRALRRELVHRRGLVRRLSGWLALPPFRRA